jgi:signal transduction histidine kinase
VYNLFLSATLRVTLFTVLLLAIVLGSTSAYLVRQIYQQQAETLASRVAVAVSFRLTSDLPVNQEYLDALSGKDTVRVTFDDGTVETSTAQPEGRQFTATRNDPLGEFTLQAGIDQDNSYAIFAAIAGIVSVVTGVALLLAYYVAGRESRRVNKPLSDLAVHAESIGGGTPDTKTSPTGIDEIDRVARVLDSRAAMINEVLEAERRTSREMSHQVRTPLTALSLRLEEIIATEDLADAKAEAAVGVVQIERLSEVIDQLVRGRREGLDTQQERVDLTRLVSEQMVEWYPAFSVRRRRISLIASGAVYAYVTRVSQSQVLSTLIENCLIHGRGDVHIKVRESGNSAVLEVVDTRGVMRLREGQDPFERGVSASGTGLGLALARTLVAADDGDIAMTSRKPPTFTVYLPMYRGQHAVPAADDASIGPA